MDQTDYWVVGFTDGSLDYSATCIYIISASKTDSNCKAQLITTATKIAIHNISDEILVLSNETFASTMGADLLLNVTTIMTQLAIPVKTVSYFVMQFQH